VDYGHLAQVCDAMVEQVLAMARLGHRVRAISAGGGLTIPYRPGEAPVDTAHYFSLWDAARRRIAQHLGHPVSLEIEPGRFLVAEAGVMLAEVRAVKDMGRNHFVLCDAGFSDLVRPAMYGGYHAISVLPRAEAAPGARLQPRPTVVAGPLCESGDVFTQDAHGVVEPRLLASAAVGDLLVFHDTGAYGASMSSNYNSRPLAAEVLVDAGVPRLIRRRQTVAELIALEDV
jgi:diaminopimelate decarboxylase